MLRLTGTSGGGTRRDTYNQLAGTRPAFFRRYLNAHPLLLVLDPGGATWFQLYPDVCVEKGRTWVPFRLQVSEMSDMILLKTGVNIATSLNMGGRLSQDCIS